MKLARVWLLAALPLAAHVGSPDIFFEGAAGAYRLMVTIRPPQVVPGVAEIEIRSASPAAREVHVVPLRMTGIAATLAPTPDLARPSTDDPNFYTGSLWLMTTGSWKVRVDVDGTDGKGTLFVPVPALATSVKGMQKGLGVLLFSLCALLAVGLVSIAGAGAREAQLEPGTLPEAAQWRVSRIVMGVAAAIVVAALWLGYSWWGNSADDYFSQVYKPLQLDGVVEHSPAGAHLRVTLTDPGWLNRRTDDLLLDHGHLMHLYVVRKPELDYAWHLHPERVDHATFAQTLPTMPAGQYALYGDIVHEGGLAETAAGEMQVQGIQGAPLAGDDAGGAVPKIGASGDTVALADGWRMVWDRGQPLRARVPVPLHFRLEDSMGRPAPDMELYMGMLGHAAILAADGSVFAHIHPFGSVAMPALELAGGMDPHAGHRMATDGLPAEASFPYGFPKTGRYRIFVQMKHAGKIETGAFDAVVEN